MLRTIVVTILLFSFIIKPHLPFLEYAINYTYITGTLCKNKDKPELECNGKCHLAKKIVETTTDDADKNTVKNRISQLYNELLYLSTDTEISDFTHTNTLSKKIKYTYINLYKREYKDKHFHPPNFI